ncbi:MAG: hypothetical protein ACREA7_06995 [Nitrosotalea sp.]
MKSRYHFIIAGSGIFAAIVISFLVMNLSSQQISLEGLGNSYKAGDMVQPTLKFNDKDSGCNDPKIMVLNATNRSQIFLDSHAHYETCHNYSVGFYAGVNGDSIINSTQSYILAGSVGDKSIEKEFVVKPDHQHPRFYTVLQIGNLDKTYAKGQPIDFTVSVNGYGVFNAGLRPTVAIENSNGEKIWSVDPNKLLQCCPAELFELNRTLAAVEIGGPPTINKAGTYKMIASYENTKTEKEFTVSYAESNSIPSSHSGVIPVMVNENYTGVSLNYTITDGPYNKVLGAQINEKDGYFSLVLKTTRNGFLSIGLPRALLDAKMHNQDEQFIVLTDGYVVQYNETKSLTERDLTIPFKAGITTVEITVPRLI